jgi:hypothetical protein
MAIKTEISAIVGRDSVEADITTRKKTIVPHSVEPPYFTTNAGSPRPSPKPRKARPAIMIDRHSKARTIIKTPRFLAGSARYSAWRADLGHGRGPDFAKVTFTKS